MHSTVNCKVAGSSPPCPTRFLGLPLKMSRRNFLEGVSTRIGLYCILRRGRGSMLVVESGLFQLSILHTMYIFLCINEA